MRISEKFMTKYKNMNLTRKMLLVYFGFAGVFLVVAVIAFQISMEAFEKRLYENSLHELDYYIQDVRDGLNDVENRSREMAIDSEIQETAIQLSEMGPGTLVYSPDDDESQMAACISEYGKERIGDQRSALYRPVRQFSGVCGVSRGISQRMRWSGLWSWWRRPNGEAVMYGPTRDCGYLLCGRKVLRWNDISLDNLGHTHLLLRCREDHRQLTRSRWRRIILRFLYIQMTL